VEHDDVMKFVRLLDNSPLSAQGSDYRLTLCADAYIVSILCVGSFS
jgi:hypothetical protein